MSLLRLTACAATAVVALHARATVALAQTSENTPLKLDDPATTPGQGSSGGGLVRTVVGLAVVVAVIWGLSWVLRQVKTSRQERASGSGLASVAMLPLGTGRSLHVVHAGREVLLLGVSEHQVTRLGSWSESEAEAVGLVIRPDDAPSHPLAAQLPTGGAARPTGAELLDALRKRSVRR